MLPMLRRRPRLHSRRRKRRNRGEAAASAPAPGDGGPPLLRSSRAVFARRAGGAVVDERAIDKAPPGMALLIAANPYKAFARAAQAFYPPRPVEPRRAPSAIIDLAAIVPADCDIAE